MSPAVKLQGSRFATTEDIDAMMTNFESMAKPTFRDPSVSSYIKFGGPRDSDERFNIRRGTLTLSGYVRAFVSLAIFSHRVRSEMASLLRPSIDAIKAAIDKQLTGVDPNIVVSDRSLRLPRCSDQQ